MHRLPNATSVARIAGLLATGLSLSTAMQSNSNLITLICRRLIVGPLHNFLQGASSFSSSLHHRYGHGAVASPSPSPPARPFQYRQGQHPGTHARWSRLLPRSVRSFSIHALQSPLTSTHPTAPTPLGRYAICASSTCTLTGGSIETKLSTGGTATYPEAVCTCPVIKSKCCVCTRIRCV